MFGVIVAVVVSNTVAVLLHTEGVYESELEAQLQVSYLAQQPPRTLRRLTAQQLMSSPVAGLPGVVPVHVAQSVLRSSAHNGFPVYDARCQDPLTGRYRLDGFIMRSQVELLLQQGVHCDQHGRYLHQPPDVPAFEQRVAAAMANRLQHHPSGRSSMLQQLAAASSGQEAEALLASSSSSGLAALAKHPSPFDNQVTSA
jgi:chloride channel 7